jgi:hypothetical protein
MDVNCIGMMSFIKLSKAEHVQSTARRALWYTSCLGTRPQTWVGQEAPYRLQPCPTTRPPLPARPAPSLPDCTPDHRRRLISPERSSAVVASTKQGCMQLPKYSARASAWTSTWRRTAEEHLAALDARDANGSELEEAHPLTHAMVDAATKDEAFASTMAAVPSLIG